MSNKVEQLINLYTHRIATTDKPCFVCNKYTKSVLRTDNGLDWFYTCESHLSDRGFATPVPEPEPEPEPKPPVVQLSTKAKVSHRDNSSKSKSDSDSNQEKDKPNDSTKEEEDKQQGKGEKKEDDDRIKEQTKEKKQVAISKSPQPTKPKQYILHNNIFYLREDKLNKKRQKVEAQNILNKLPSVPKTSLQ